MRLDSIHTLHLHEPIMSSPEWLKAMQDVREAVAAVVWPKGNDRFVINPTPRPNKKGELQNHQNGVMPIKNAFIDSLVLHGWRSEQTAVAHVGKVDAVLETSVGVFGVEWETGNISSSHRSLNRLSLGVLRKSLAGGVLVVPTRMLYRFVTDRVGNLAEIARYFEIYQTLPLEKCALVVVAVEYDGLDPNAPYISKGTDGWALLQRATT